MHHLDHETDETLVPLFEKNPGGVEKNSAFNKLTMPSRNYAIIAENKGAEMTNRVNGKHGTNGLAIENGHQNSHFPNDDQVNGSKASTAAAATDKKPGSLEVCYRVEIDPHDAQGHTDGYGFNIPPLEM